MKMNKYECKCSDTVCKLESNKRPTFCHYYSHIAPDWQLVNAEVPNLERWKPNKGETYCFIDVNDGLNCHIWKNDDMDKYLYENCNCFKTVEEAERALEKVKETLLKCHKEYSNE